MTPPSTRLSARSFAMKKKNDPIDDDEMPAEFDFSRSIPNPFATGYARNRNLRILAPDLIEVFPDSQSVNEALRTIVRITSAANTAAAPKTKKRVV
jgi:hypothetical protein